MRSLVVRPLVFVLYFIRHNFWLKLLSVIIAVSLWVVVFGSRTIEITKEVPFEVLSTDDQILADPVPEKIVFRLTGPKAFLRNITARIEDPIRANVRDLPSGVFTHRIYSDSIKLPLGVKVQSINPNVVQIRVEELKRKLVSVRPEVAGQVPADYKLLRTEVLPAQMRIKGPKNRIANLALLSSLPIDLSSIRETTVVPLAFDFKSLGIEPGSTVPEMSIEIQGKGQAFRVRHVPIRLRGSNKAKSSDEEVMVIVRTDPADNIKIDGDSVSAEIDVRDVPDGEYARFIRVTLPDKVHLVRVIPSLTKVTVKGQ